MQAKHWIISAACFALLVGGEYVGSVYIGLWVDSWSQPWAYSIRSSAKLLPGIWAGQFVDADGVQRRLEITVSVPYPMEDRTDRSGDHFTNPNTRRAVIPDKFKAQASVTHGAINDQYTGFGEIISNDAHTFELKFQDKNDAKPTPRFALRRTTAARWHGDVMEITIDLSPRNPNGTPASTLIHITKKDGHPAGYSEPVVAKTVQVTLNREQRLR
jgi:hypothetical protein